MKTFTPYCYYKYLCIIIFNLIITISNANQLSNIQLNHMLNSHDACFILYNLKTSQTVLEYNKNDYCNEPIATDSTFTIPLSLMAFDQRIITESTIFIWNKKAYPINEWNQNQTLLTWFKYSVDWVSWQIISQLGFYKIKYYLSGFKYGDRDFYRSLVKQKGLTYTSLNSNLKISGINQLQFLHSMFEYRLPVSKIAIENTKQSIYLGTTNNGMDLYGQTSSGSHLNNDKSQIKMIDGWFIGYLENNDQQYIFVTCLSNPNKSGISANTYGGATAKTRTLQILNTYFK